jgi:hypothetical protein
MKKVVATNLIGAACLFDWISGASMLAQQKERFRKVLALLELGKTTLCQLYYPLTRFDIDYNIVDIPHFFA